MSGLSSMGGVGGWGGWGGGLVSPNVQFLPFLLELSSRDNVASSVSRCPVLWVDRFLSECVGGSELDWNVVFLEDSPECFPDSSQVGDRGAVVFIPPLLCWGLSGALGEGPVWVSTCSERCFKVLLFFLLPLGCGGFFFGLVL